MALLAMVSPAFAAHDQRPEATQLHWHTKTATYQMTESIPSDWRPHIRDAASTWTANTPLSFEEGAMLPASYVSYFDQTTHIVTLAEAPPEWWLWCTPPVAIACTRYAELYTLEVPTDHLVDVDVIFNAHHLPQFVLTCPEGGPPHPAPQNFDVQFVALHEFGHWGVLEHTTTSGDVMKGDYEDCRRILSTNDDDNMTAHYAGH